MLQQSQIQAAFLSLRADIQGLFLPDILFFSQGHACGKLTGRSFESIPKHIQHLELSWCDNYHCCKDLGKCLWLKLLKMYFHYVMRFDFMLFFISHNGESTVIPYIIAKNSCGTDLMRLISKC